MSQAKRQQIRRLIAFALVGPALTWLWIFYIATGIPFELTLYTAQEPDRLFGGKHD